MRCMRCTSAYIPRVSRWDASILPRSAPRSSISRLPLKAVRGVRNSCDTSATKRFWRWKATSSCATMRLNERARRPISSSIGGESIRMESSPCAMRRLVRSISTRGRSATLTNGKIKMIASTTVPMIPKNTAWWKGVRKSSTGVVGVLIWRIPTVCRLLTSGINTTNWRPPVALLAIT